MAVNPAYLAEASKCVDCLSESQKENATVFLLDNIALNLASGGGIHDLLSPSHPDTVPSFVLRGSLIVGDSTPLWSQFPIGEGDMVLRSNGSDPIWAKLALNTDVVGTLAVANGGTGSSTALNNNRIMVSSGGKIVEAAALTNGQLLIGSTGAAPVAASLIAGANITITPGAGSITIAAIVPAVAHTILDAAVHTDSVTQAVVRGSLIYGNSTPKWDRLAIGSAGMVLTSDGTDVSWATPASAGTVTSFSAGNLAPLFTTAVATATTTPALTFSLSTQAANLVFAGPASGAAAGPTFRSLAALDLPATAVAPAIYGSATQVGQFTVDQQGRITLAANVAITYPGSFSGFAAPSALVGLSAIAGVATTGIRSDGAPALDQNIAPTWTSPHIWTPPANTTPITVSGYSLTGANTQALLNLSGTWNTSGAADGILFNVVNTASSGSSRLISLSLDGLRRFEVYRNGFAWIVQNDTVVNASSIVMEVYHHSTSGTPTTNNGAGIDFAMDSSTTVRQAGGRITTDWTVATHATRTSRMGFFVTSNAAVNTQLFQITPTLVSVLNSATFSVSAQNAIQVSPFGAAAGNTSEVRYMELAASGTNYTGFKAADSIAASEIYVLPNAAPAGNRFLQAAAVAGGVSVLSWAQISLTADMTGVLPAASGGTGQSSYAVGDILYADTTTSLAKLADVATGNALISGGVSTAPNWGKVALTTHVSGILPVANGGSGTSTAFTAGSVVFAGPAGVFTQDNANLFYDDAANRLTVNQYGIPNTTSATVGGIYFGGTLAIHNFGTNNFFIGKSIGNFTMTGTNNSAIGNNILTLNTTGGGNNVMGISALSKNTTGMRNVAIGSSALSDNTTGSDNVGLGNNALTANTIGTSNVGIGASALLVNLDGISNMAIGTSSLRSNVSGNLNTAIGVQALRDSTGSNNVAIGTNALLVNSSGGQNIAIGVIAGDNLTTGSNNIIIGYNIDSPTATNSNTLTIGNLLFGTGIDGTGVVLSTGNIGIGVITPLAKFHVTNSAAATVATIIKAAAAQSADLTQWQNSSATPFVVVDATGCVGIGQTTAFSALLNVRQTVTSTLAQYGSISELDFTLSSGNVAESQGLGAVVRFRGTGGNTSGAKGVSGLAGSAFCYNTGTTDYMQGFFNDVRNLGAGTVTHLSAVRCAVILNSGGGVVTNAYGVKVENQTAGTNNYGVHSSVNTGATSWNFYAATNAKNYFGGSIGIAVTSPTAYLHISAGTASAGAAPLKFTTGISNGTAEAGAVEFTTDDLFFSISTGPARKRLLMADATAGLTSGKMPIATTNGRLIDLTASAAYTPTNVVADRSFDAATVLTPELANVVGAMIADLQAKGILG